MLHADEAADTEEKPKTADVVDVGPGSADCLALHKKGLYVAGQVSCYPVHLRALLPCSSQGHFKQSFGLKPHW